MGNKNSKAIPIEDSEYYQFVQQLRLLDDNFMVMVFDDQKELVQHLVRTILGRDDITVKDVITQRECKGVCGKSVRLDISATDTNGVWYDIEIQRSNQKDLAKRMRYIAAMMDGKSLDAGAKYAKLPETYIIFILENDPNTFKNGEAIIEIGQYKSTGEKYDDGVHKILVNAAYKGTDDIGKLMHDFRVSSPQEMHHKPLAKRVTYFKYEEGANTMCELFEKFGAEKEQEGHQQGQREQMEKTVLSVVDDGVCNIEKIAKYAATTVEVVREILDKHKIVLKAAPKSN